MYGCRDMTSELAHVGLDRPVRDVMSAGVITIAEDASISQARHAMARHRVNAVLVLARRDSAPLGWVTSRGLLGWIERQPTLTSVGRAISEPVRTIDARAPIADAARELALGDVSHLLVCGGSGRFPEGVVSALDIVVASG